MADELVEEARKISPLVFVDFHGEATSEKIAFGWHLDGRVSAVVGTHTHVQTADARIFPGGTAYITDVGMTGPYDEILGMKKESVIYKFQTNMPSRFEVPKSEETYSVAFSLILITKRAKPLFVKEFTLMTIILSKDNSQDFA